MILSASVFFGVIAFDMAIAACHYSFLALCFDYVPNLHPHYLEGRCMRWTFEPCLARCVCTFILLRSACPAMLYKVARRVVVCIWPSRLAVLAAHAWIHLHPI